MLQPSVLEQLITIADGQGRNTGFLARMLLTYPDSTIGKRFYIPPNKNQEESMQRYSKRISEIIRIDIPVDEQGDIEPKILGCVDIHFSHRYMLAM